MATKVVGLVDCFNLPTFGPLTKHRLRASTVFLGRYCYIDFQGYSGLVYKTSPFLVLRYD